MVEGGEGGLEVGGVDEVPLGVGLVGLGDHLFDGVHVGAVLAVAPPVFRGDAPGGLGVAFELDEALLLFAFGDGEEELDDLDAAGAELAFEDVDFVPELGEFFFVQLSFGPGVEHEVVGAAVVELDLAVGGRVGPVAVEEWEGAGLFVGGVCGVDFEDAGVDFEEDFVE